MNTNKTDRSTLHFPERRNSSPLERLRQSKLKSQLGKIKRTRRIRKRRRIRKKRRIKRIRKIKRVIRKLSQGKKRRKTLLPK
jgi:hypothetical protein